VTIPTARGQTWQGRASCSGSGVAKVGRSAPGGTMGYSVGYKPVQDLLK